MNSKPRHRLHAEQTAKNFWKIDATIEFDSETMIISTDQNDLAILKSVTLGEKLLEIIKRTETAFREDGRKLVSDLKEIESE